KQAVASSLLAGPLSRGPTGTMVRRPLALRHPQGARGRPRRGRRAASARGALNPSPPGGHHAATPSDALDLGEDALLAVGRRRVRREELIDDARLLLAQLSERVEDAEERVRV